MRRRLAVNELAPRRLTNINKVSGIERDNSINTDRSVGENTPKDTIRQAQLSVRSPVSLSLLKAKFKSFVSIGLIIQKNQLVRRDKLPPVTFHLNCPRLILHEFCRNRFVKNRPNDHARVSAAGIEKRREQISRLQMVLIRDVVKTYQKACIEADVHLLIQCACYR